MRTVPLRDSVLWLATSKMGLDPTVDLLKDQADAAARYLNSWVRKCWDAFDWPELTKTEPRNPVNHLVPYDIGVQPPPQWASNLTFNINDVARDPVTSTNIYVSVQNANTNHALTLTAWWTLIPAWDKTQTYAANAKVSDPVSGIVYIAQQIIQPNSVLADSLRNQAAWLPIQNQQQPPANLTPIGKILKVYMQDPTAFDGPFDCPFRELDSAFHVGFFHGISVWVKFMQRPFQYTFTVWSATTTYHQFSVSGSLSDLVYDPNLGECYASLSAVNLNRPLPGSRTSTSFWQWIPFPAVIAEPCARGLYSDLLRDEGEPDLAKVEEEAALAELQLAIQRNVITRYDKLTDQQTGVPRMGSLASTGAA